MRLGRCRIKPGVFFGSALVSIGDRSFVNYGAFFDGSAAISVGPDCSIGYQAMFIASTHDLGPSSSRAGGDKAKQIEVARGCWIGARAVILGGVTIEEGCVIAAGSVVTSNCSSNGLYAGVPARRIRDLSSTGK